MADLLDKTDLTWVIRVGIVVAVVVAVLLVRGVGDDGEASDGAGDSPTSTTPSATPTEVDPDTFCEQFRKFADAQAQYVAAPEDPMGEEALVEAGDTLLSLGQPIGLSDAGLISLRKLVAGALAQEGDPADIPTDAPDDPAALDQYLAASCPA